MPPAVIDVAISQQAVSSDAQKRLVAQAAVPDVSDADSVAALFADHAGFVLVIDNAGIPGEGSALDMGSAAFQSVIDTNPTGVFPVAQSAARLMTPAGGGAIVEIASIFGLRVAGGVSAVAASQAAVVQLAKALALEWARHGIRVNALCPGYVEAPINADFFATGTGQALIRRIPQLRRGRLSGLDAPLLLRASDASAFMTGSILAVDGGHLVSGL